MKAPRLGRDRFALVEAVVALTILAVVLLPLVGGSRLPTAMFKRGRPLR